MNLSPGARLGPYEIDGKIGAGGMGEVYRARDPRLGREVAIKVLPAARNDDPDAIARFELEARAAAALAHPNILVVHDVCMCDGVPYIVSELLEGESLRARLDGGAIPVRKAAELAAQIAHALAAAHDKGIVHRDLKPENLFVTPDGRVKVLDFGIAKLTGSDAGPPGSVAGQTAPGEILGSVGYMAPEQVRGQPADHRSDIFSLGAILYEMLAGARAFEGPTPVETAYAILNEEPADLLEAGRSIPPGLARIVARCLEKRPTERFQSARDLAFDLEALSGLADTGTAARARSAWRWRRGARVAAAAVGLLALAAAAFVAGVLVPRSSQAPNPTALLGPPPGGPPPAPAAAPPAAAAWEKLTFQRGGVHAARFGPDEKTVIFAAAWNGGMWEIYTTLPGNPEARSLGFGEAGLLAVSRDSGELALVQKKRDLGARGKVGVLARAPLAGGAPRQVLEGVLYADFGPGGRDVAVIRMVDEGLRLEYPIGKVLRSARPGAFDFARVSPDGERVAFIDHPTPHDDRGAIAVVDRAGNYRALTPVFASAQGLAWGPGGGEIWFTAAEKGASRALHAVTLDGEQRVIARVPGTLTLHDVSPSGRILVTHEQPRMGVVTRPVGEGMERDLSWFDWSLLGDLSADGRQVIIHESGDGAGAAYGIYLRSIDGGPAVRLGDGNLPIALSPDGKWVLAVAGHERDRMILLPTGPGESRTITVGVPAQYEEATWFPDSRRVLLQARAPGEQARIWILDVESGEAKALTEPGSLLIKPHAVSPDGKSFCALEKATKRGVIQPIDVGAPRVVLGEVRGELPIGWSADGKALFVLVGDDLPARIDRLELATGKRQLVRELALPDPAGVIKLNAVSITPDGKTVAYSYHRMLSALYLVSPAAE